MERLTAFFEKILSPSVLLWFSFAVTVVSTALSMIFLEDIYRDVGNVYATCTRLFSEGHFSEALNPALPIISIFIAGAVSWLTNLDPLDSLLLTGGLFYAALIPPLYILLKRFLSPRLAAWGVLLTVLAPKLLRISISGMPEPARNFFLVLLLCFVFSFFDRQKWYKTVLIAFAMAGLTLSRSEGFLLSIMVSFVIFCFTLWIHWKEDWKNKFQRSFLYTSLIIIFFLLFLMPRIYQNYQITGYPTPDARLNRYIYEYITSSKPLRDLSDNRNVYAQVVIPRVSRERSFFKQFGLVVQQSIRGGYEVYMVFAGIGVLVLLLTRRIRRSLFCDWSPDTSFAIHKLEYLFILLIYLFHNLIYFKLNISYRYYVFLIPLLMPLTMTGIYFCWRLLVLFRLQILAIVGVFLLLVLQFLNGVAILREQNFNHKKAGEWIRDHFKKGKNLRVLNYQSYVVYWIDGKIANAFYEGPETRPESASEFDIAIMEADDERLLKIFRSRKDVEEVPSPYRNTVVIFRKLCNE